MYVGTGRRHGIRKVENMGEIITLDDSSRWKVSLFDKSKSMMWMVLDQVAVSQAGLRYRLTHVKRNESVEAEYLA